MHTCTRTHQISAKAKGTSTLTHFFFLRAEQKLFLSLSFSLLHPTAGLRQHLHVVLLLYVVLLPSLGLAFMRRTPVEMQ